MVFKHLIVESETLRYRIEIGRVNFKQCFSPITQAEFANRGLISLSKFLRLPQSLKLKTVLAIKVVKTDSKIIILTSEIDCMSRREIVRICFTNESCYIQPCRKI